MDIKYLKTQLNIESGYTESDVILQHYLNVAEQSVLNYLNLYTGSTSGYTGSSLTSGYTGTTRPVSIDQSVLLLASHFYVTRQLVAYGQAYKIPYTMEYLLNNYKEFTVT